MAFTDELTRLNVPYKDGSREGELRLCCPFCPDRGETEDTKFRLGVNVSTGFAHCFNCGWKTRNAAPMWVLRKLGAPVPEAEEYTEEERKPEKVSKPDDWEYVHTLDREDGIWYRGFQYLIDRGMTVQEMKKYRVGISMSGKLQYRIIFPVYWEGKLRGLVARDFTGQAAVKYLNSKGEKVIWNVPDECSTIWISEGIFKSIAIERALRVHACALLGNTISEKQVEQLIAAKVRKAVYWPDPGRPGVEGALQVSERLKAEGIRMYVIWPVPKKQADEYSSGALCKLSKRKQLMTWQLKCTMESDVAFGRIQ